MLVFGEMIPSKDEDDAVPSHFRKIALSIAVTSMAVVAAFRVMAVEPDTVAS